MDGKAQKIRNYPEIKRTESNHIDDKTRDNFLLK